MVDKIKSLYIHFPFCRHLCNYCEFYKHKLEQVQDVLDYEELLIKQITAHKVLLEEKNMEFGELDSLYIGGGTPSLWSLKGPIFLKEFLLSQLKLSKNCEFTIEVDPGTWTKQEISSWIEVGVNRFSIGVQSYDQEYLKILDRKHTKSEIDVLLSYLQEIGANFSIDLLIGIPTLSNTRDLESEIKELIGFSPNHFSVYILKCRKNYPHLSLLPTEDDSADEYLEVCRLLNNFGFLQYEVSNFAKKGWESIHNKKYWEYLSSVAALGPSGSGLLLMGKDKDKALRYKWKSMSEGFQTENLEGTSLTIEKIYMKLRAKGLMSVDFFDGENQQRFLKLIEAWDRQGYIAASKPCLELTPCGYLLLDSLMDDIFKELTI